MFQRDLWGGATRVGDGILANLLSRLGGWPGAPHRRNGGLMISWTRIADLHPTQITVGFREVAQKRLRCRAGVPNTSRRVALRKVAPVVLGPSGGLYLIDRHHFVCAAKMEGLDEVLIRQVADFSGLAPLQFWRALEAREWCHPFDSDGRRRAFADIPSSIDALTDDPYRSLASALRRAGGFRKTPKPFSEFAWADFLRFRISREAVETDFEGALDDALGLARTSAAFGLPGWRLESASSLRAQPLIASTHAF
jgi:hypothetical protein